MDIRVVNFQDVKQHWDRTAQTWDDPQYVYIGRENKRYGLPDSIWGNPWPMRTEKDRQQVIQRYRRYVLGCFDLMMRIATLRGKTLVCWCAPNACHGHVLAEIAALTKEDFAEHLEWAGIAGGPDRLDSPYNPQDRHKREKVKEIIDLQNPVAPAIAPTVEPKQLSLF